MTTRKSADEELWPDNAVCRRELAQLQERIRTYAVGYAKLAGVDDATTLMVAADQRETDGSR